MVKICLVNYFLCFFLLYGDFWFGNVVNIVNGFLCFDFVCYWGDCECDIVFVEWFGGF